MLSLDLAKIEDRYTRDIFRQLVSAINKGKSPTSTKYGHSEVRASTPDGYGGNADNIPTFAVVDTIKGAAIKMSTSGANGTYFSISEDGLYLALFNCIEPLQDMYIGISVNANNLNVAIDQLAYAQGMRGICHILTGGSGEVCVPIYLKKGDIVRPHTDGQAMPSDGHSFFSLTRVG
jgi:hypothetical protein